MPKKDKKDKKKWKLKNVTGKQWMQAGQAISGAGKKLADVESSERAKTQALKDQLYIRRRKGG
mgnify:CR=1 FL=1|tara:strand:+ start:752 stop:940 length:189 start_codon:yes stop_codon:yes gene_type:complete